MPVTLRSGLPSLRAALVVARFLSDGDAIFAYEGPLETTVFLQLILAPMVGVERFVAACTGMATSASAALQCPTCPFPEVPYVGRPVVFMPKTSVPALTLVGLYVIC